MHCVLLLIVWSYGPREGIDQDASKTKNQNMNDYLEQLQRRRVCVASRRQEADVSRPGLMEGPHV